MKIVLSTPGKFHSFDLARELLRNDHLAAIFTGYPRFKLTNEEIPKNRIYTFPWLHTPYMAVTARYKLPLKIARMWEFSSAVALDHYVARNMPECDAFVGLSGSSGISGAEAHRRGIPYICDRGSSHIRTQDRLLREEHDRWGIPFSGIDPRTIERETNEYTQADCITVPSKFVLNSFLSEGVPVQKLQLLPYGVNLTRFNPTTIPAPDRFDVLFVGAMSLRKGVQYLMQAYSKLSHPAKSLTFVGTPSLSIVDMLKRMGLWTSNINILGHVPQIRLKEIMSRSHVMVLPSIEEGLAMVQAQAMACGCPVIASKNTGSEDLFTDSVEGFIVPNRDWEQLANKLQYLADNPEKRAEFAKASLRRVANLGGWNAYGMAAINIYKNIIDHQRHNSCI